MPKTVTASEAQSHFGSMLQWAIEHSEGVIVERRGKPSAAIISYAEYEELTRLRKMEKKRQAFETLKTIRRRVQRQNTDLSAEAAYRAAGFGETVIQETLKKDDDIAAMEP
jgi:prevent-host-death family protein